MSVLILYLVLLAAYAAMMMPSVPKFLGWRERRAVQRLAAKLDGWRPVKPYPGLFSEGASGRYVDRLLAMHPSDRTLYALKCAFEDEQRLAPQKEEQQ